MKKNKKNREKKPMKDWEKKFIFFKIKADNGSRTRLSSLGS